MTARQPTSAATAERRQRVLELRKAGMSAAQIANVLSITATTVKRDLKACFQAAGDHETSQHSSLDLERIDMALMALVKDVKKGEHSAIDRWIKLCDLRRRLYSTRRDDEGGPNVQVKVIANLDLKRIEKQDREGKR